MCREIRPLARRVDVGYRWYDAKGETPLFPFGYGLSYTTFAFSGLRISRASVNGTSDVRVSAWITSTGSQTGSDVAHLYVGDPGSTGEPPRQLAGFTRVILAPGLDWRTSSGYTDAFEAMLTQPRLIHLHFMIIY